jgi:hypothetical protein
MNALAPISSTLAKCIRMLSSDKPGDITAAVGALQRTLKSAGADFHALARVVEFAIADGPPMTEAEMKKIFDAGYAQGRSVGFTEGLEAAKRDSRAIGFRNFDDVDWERWPSGAMPAAACWTLATGDSSNR